MDNPPAPADSPPLPASPPVDTAAPLALPPAEPEPPAATSPPQTHGHTAPVRLFLVVMVLFLGLFLIVRTLLLEPFGVPTGSMAPALIGHHRAAPCPRCGFPVRVGMPPAGTAAEHFAGVLCQNCEQRLSLTDARDLNGDRLLVDKNVYELRRPRRWEMAVFRCPDPDPREFGKPYVKRVIGLPGETVTVADGDVYVNGRLARKGLAEVRETLFPVFDMTHPPGGGGWAVRWLVSPADPRLPAGGPNPAPASEPPTLAGTALVLDASASPQATAGATYRHWNLDEHREEPIRVWNAYDGPPRRAFGTPAMAHDFVLTCEVEVTATTTAEAGFACRLMDGADAVSAEFPVGPEGTGRAHLVRERHGGLGAAGGVALRPNRRHRLEFAFVDRQALLALDGTLVVPPAELEPARQRDGVSRPLQFGARGCRVVLHDVRLSRDIHYTQYGVHGTRNPAALGAGEYYMLGDNSGNSQDSRKWPTPGVPEADFIGKPFLVHQPLRPARATIGGREREFQTLDWARLRWLH